ncbi:hypothetical protein [Streptomyces nitrosporeus]|uniref:hypothetical protein n=1 Tax=Streptomyces nitrosporeus TaxID=28894 RepID=UPI00399F04E9
MADRAEPSLLRAVTLLVVLSGTLGLSGCGGGESRGSGDAAPGISPSSSSAPASPPPSAAAPPPPTPSCVPGDKDWLDSALLGRSVNSYLPVEFGGPPELCEPVTVHVGYFDVFFTTAMDGAEPKQGYTVETVDRQRFTVDGSAPVRAVPPPGGVPDFPCTGRLMTITLGKQVGPGDIETISWSQYEGDDAVGNVGISFKENERIVRYDLQTPTGLSAC